ncbi:MAG TPA: dihydrolipoamide acetyltransferase family protein [Chloroflexota bacterium]|nr:dihydrolipoamide acetyltransferase family protein [Chloroflexota bacterium]
MATEVVMPRLSDTMETGTIAKWLKNVGDQVDKGETIAEIETDKANMEMESYASGILAKITVGEGQSAGVGEPIAVIAANESEAKTLQNGPQPEAPETTGKDEPDQVPPDQGPPSQPQIGKTEPNERIKASPLARRLAQEHEINLSDVGGTGPGGRITKEDVLSFLKQTAPVGQAAQQQAPAPAPTRQEAPARRPEQPQPSGGRGGQPVEMTRMQRTIARRMTEARFSKPDFVLTVDIDMTAARQLLQNIAGTANAPKVGPNDLLIKAAALALVRHPKVNAGWEGDSIVRYNRVNVGFAVALEDGLVVPVVRDADQKSLGEIARDAKELIDKARSGKLAPSDYEDGTFTISNLGMYGIEQFTPIINPPEACIMGVGAIEQRPVVVDGQVTIRDRMRVSLACDHRVIDGAQGAQFLRTFVGLLENPMLTVL